MSPEHLAKPALRKHLREQRRHLAPAFKAQAAAAVATLARALPAWDTARRIALYWPSDGELDPLPLAAACREQQRELYLPVLADEKRLTFRCWKADTNFVVNQFGIPEPEPESSSPELTARLDIIFLPLVGWQRDGYRLGMGGGFYDRTLAGVEGPLRVGLGFACQEISGLRAEPWDIALDYVLVETALHRCARAEPRGVLT